MSKNILGLDVGDKVIGVARCQSGSFIVTPLPPIQRTDGSLALGQLKKILTVNSIEQIVIGLPLNDDGSDSEMASKIRQYASKLKKHFPELKITFQDEHLSTWSVREKYPRLKLKKGETEKNVDSFAAMEILEDFLEGTGSAE